MNERPIRGHYIDKSSWARRQTFEFFSPYEQPFFSLTVHLDVTELYRFSKQLGLSYFLTNWYAILRALNDIPQLRQRLRGDEVWEHDEISIVSTFLLENDTFGFCYLNMAPNLSTFVEQGMAAIRALKAGEPTSYNPDADRDDLVYGTVIPWINFLGVTHPHRIPSRGSVPVVTCGKRFKKGDRYLTAFSLEVHHSVADGLHVGRFFEQVQRYCDAPRLLA